MIEMIRMNYSRTLLAAATLLTASTAFGQTVNYSFDDLTNPFSGGTISTDYASSGSSSLYFDLNVQGSFDLPADYLGKTVQISMDVLDLGKYIDTGTRAEGARVGVAGGGYTGAETVAFAIYNGNGFAPSNAGYVRNQNDYAVNSGTWWGVDFWSGSTRAALSDTAGGSIAASPEWFTVTWDVDVAGAVSMASTVSPNAVTDDIGTWASRILIHGGRTSTLAGVYIDNVSISVVAVPEPQSMAFILSGMGLCAMLLRRRRS
jgi:hypothetical protein